MADGRVRVERVHGDVVRCTLDRPPLNLLEPGIIAALRDAFDALARDASVRAAVVTGAGPRSRPAWTCTSCVTSTCPRRRR
jgi:enoyl-CoA hydratase/carnithine racemase